MAQSVAYAYESRPRQQQATSGRSTFKSYHQAIPQQVKEEKVLRLSGDEIAKVILVVIASSWVGWLLSALSPALGTF